MLEKMDFILNLCFPEPGYYEDGNFGIRLENVLIINEADTKFNFGDKGYLAFEHITWVSWFNIIDDILCCFLVWVVSVISFFLVAGSFYLYLFWFIYTHKWLNLDFKW